MRQRTSWFCSEVDTAHTGQLKNSAHYEPFYLNVADNFEVAGRIRGPVLVQGFHADRMVLADEARIFEFDIDAIVKNATTKGAPQKADQSMDWFDFIIKYKVGV